ncbi:type II secretion system protein [Clostridium vincentii]|uniref:Putative major pilin subunit n=1 Tax=Clostridium vincentii TaxID=52704 RepID=A0A2T0BFZ1_9CLOT|nr:type II secretion system protein [Clostridium vincentii]PRR82747.1 putative major pilin subunit [Clostridium vincentii]
MNLTNRKGKKPKGGFTLVELIAVLAIISILFTVFTPKVVGYIKEAKKIKALSEVRQVVMAVDTYNINAVTPIADGTSFTNIISKIGTEIVDCTKINSITGDITYSKMKELLEGDKSFVLNDNGEISDSETDT